MSHNLYLERYAWKESIFPNYHPTSSLGIIIVIPAFKEEHLTLALNSINACDSINTPVLIMVLINESEESDSETTEINLNCLEELDRYNSKHELLFAYKKLPAKKAGVGLARKIGMDEAVRIFEKNGTDGVIVCFDADCTCDPNYLIEIEKNFQNPKTRAGIVFYEHVLNEVHNDEIIKYETYLRYYIDALRYTGHPFAHQTLGSCIIVRSSTYQSQGGMNTRKAGEDFYFLNKVIPLGDFVEINTTTIHPSDRVSTRVPFGTGKAISKLLGTEGPYEVYNPKSFEDLRLFFNQINAFWEESTIKIPESIESFLGKGAVKEIQLIKEQTKTLDAFSKRFFLWFDAFKVLKYVHHARDNHFNQVDLNKAVKWLEKTHPGIASTDPVQQLKNLRDLDRQPLNQVK